ncbi:MAG: ECF-type sigma factor [Planctomycetota bacterium]
MGEDSRDLHEGPESLPFGEATRVLRRAACGDDADRRRLFEMVESELRELAGRAMAGETPSHTLQPTALVAELWLKLFGGEAQDFEDRGHFQAVAARAMRQILVDHARARERVKRGGGWQRVAIEDVEHASDRESQQIVDVLDLDAILDELRELSERQADVVELRFFAGLEVAEIAEALGTSERTVAREWRFARAWLMKRLEEKE